MGEPICDEATASPLPASPRWGEEPLLSHKTPPKAEYGANRALMELPDVPCTYSVASVQLVLAELFRPYHGISTNLRQSAARIARGIYLRKFKRIWMR